MSAAVVIFVPALDGSLLDGGAMPALRAQLERAQRAELVVTGLGFPETVRANVLWGAPPRVHGLTLQTQHPPSPLETALGAACRWLARFDPTMQSGLQLLERDTLCEAALRHGPGSAQLHVAARALDAELTEILAQCSDWAELWIIGSPPPEPRLHRLDPPVGAAVRGAVAEWQRAPDAKTRSALLRQHGMERVLDGESLEVLGLPRPVALAEPGFGFDDTAADFGSTDSDPRRPAQLLGWLHGESRWPASVHDVRIAPTLAARLAITGLEWGDSALS